MSLPGPPVQCVSPLAFMSCPVPYAPVPECLPGSLETGLLRLGSGVIPCCVTLQELDTLLEPSLLHLCI